MGHLRAKKKKEAILRHKIKYQRKDLTFQERTVAKWIEYLTCYNGVGVNLVKVDGSKIRLLGPESISLFSKKKLKVAPRNSKSYFSQRTRFILGRARHYLLSSYPPKKRCDRPGNKFQRLHGR